jgi:hypothetical protein
MTAQLLDVVRLWSNPPFLRFCRSRLRFRKSVFWCLLTLIVTTFVVTLIYIGRTNSLTPPQDAARSAWIPILIIQGLILMVKGTGSVSAGLIQDKIDQTLDYQRLTPLTPIRSLVGYVFGLPVLEYVMFTLTLPHLVAIIVIGAIPLSTVLSVYLAFFVCVVLYHMTGIAAGMVMRRWIWGYLLSIFLVIFVNVILPTFISQLGFKLFQHLSVWPVIGQKVLPLLVSEAAFARVTQNPFFSMSDGVPFFNWTLSPFIFTLLLQGVLITTFAVMALRRWQSSTKHSLSKPYALCFLAGFIAVLIGNLWPIITRQYMPFALFGERDIEDLGEVVTIALPLAYSLVTWLLCFILFSIVIPSHHAYVRGVRRAVKLERAAARPWEDDAGSVAVMAVFTLVALAGFWVIFHQIAASGFLDTFRASIHGFWRLPLAFGLVVFYSALLLQVFEIKPTVLVVLLLWFVPILAAIVLAAAAQDVSGPLAVVASISPLALVLSSGMLPLEGVVPIDAEGEFFAFLVGANTGLVFVLIQIGWLWHRWNRQRRVYDEERRSV